MSKRTRYSIPIEELKWQVQELGLWIDNTYELYQKKMAWFKNFWKKYKAGKFNPIKAEKGFAHLTGKAARHYNNQGFGAEYRIGLEARRMLNKELVAEFMAAAKNKEYDFMR